MSYTNCMYMLPKYESCSIRLLIICFLTLNLSPGTFHYSLAHGLDYFFCLSEGTCMPINLLYDSLLKTCSICEPLDLLIKPNPYKSPDIASVNLGTQDHNHVWLWARASVHIALSLTALPPIHMLSFIWVIACPVRLGWLMMQMWHGVLVASAGFRLWFCSYIAWAYPEFNGWMCNCWWWEMILQCVTLTMVESLTFGSPKVEHKTGTSGKLDFAIIATSSN